MARRKSERDLPPPESILALYDAGLSMSAVAAELGIAMESVRYHVHKAGKARTRLESHLLHADAGEIVRLYSAGLSMSAVARHLQTTLDVVRVRLAHAGVPLRPLAQINRTLKRTPRRPGPRLAVACAECGKTRDLPPAVAAKQKYCSRSCRSTALGRARAKARKDLLCQSCGQTFPAAGNGKGDLARQYCSNACARYALHQRRQSGKMRLIERIVEALLVGSALEYVPQYRFKPGSGLCADFYLPVHNLAIECDGDYWHSLPRQKQPNMRKDRAYRDVGIGVLHLTETEIKSDIAGCYRRIVELARCTRESSPT